MFSFNTHLSYRNQTKHLSIHPQDTFLASSPRMSEIFKAVNKKTSASSENSPGNQRTPLPSLADSPLSKRISSISLEDSTPSKSSLEDSPVTQRTASISSESSPSSKSSLEGSPAVKTSKKVRFNSSIRVVLIPETKEYIEANLSDNLWWGQRDYRRFQQESTQEITSYMKEHNLSGKEGTRKAINQSWGI